jgi:hypothetical protein
MNGPHSASSVWAYHPVAGRAPLLVLNVLRLFVEHLIHRLDRDTMTSQFVASPIVNFQFFYSQRPIPLGPLAVYASIHLWYKGVWQLSST